MPTKAANDADIQGAAVVRGDGLELVVTLGTGFGTGLFYNGDLLPHLEIAHQPFRKGEDYDQQLGEVTRKEIGETRWNKRVMKAIDNMRDLTRFDHLYIGGGTRAGCCVAICPTTSPSWTTRRGSWVGTACGCRATEGTRRTDGASAWTPGRWGRAAPR